jgi:hypothetical protein
MGKSDEYRRFGEECLKLARGMKDEKTRATFLPMAAVWLRLAEQGENVPSKVERD